jgi:hypothetical protein
MEFTSSSIPLEKEEKKESDMEEDMEEEIGLSNERMPTGSLGKKKELSEKKKKAIQAMMEGRKKQLEIDKLIKQRVDDQKRLDKIQEKTKMRQYRKEMEKELITKEQEEEKGEVTTTTISSQKQSSPPPPIKTSTNSSKEEELSFLKKLQETLSDIRMMSTLSYKELTKGKYTKKRKSKPVLTESSEEDASSSSTSSKEEESQSEEEEEEEEEEEVVKVQEKKKKKKKKRNENEEEDHGKKIVSFKNLVTEVSKRNEQYQTPKKPTIRFH